MYVYYIVKLVMRVIDPFIKFNTMKRRRKKVYKLGNKNPVERFIRALDIALSGPIM